MRVDLFFAAAIVAKVTAQDEPQGPPFTITDVTSTGTGCPSGTVDVDLDDQGGFIFHGWNLTLGMDDDFPSASCRMQISLEDIPAGHNLLVGDAMVAGNAGMDPGIMATIKTSTSWGGVANSMMSDENEIFGSAAGVQFLNMFMVNPVFDGQQSVCGSSTAVLTIDVEVTMSADEVEGKNGQGVCNVEFVGVLAGLQVCEVADDAVADDGTAPDEDSCSDE